jgi:hypothetical protein
MRQVYLLFTFVQQQGGVSCPFGHFHYHLRYIGRSFLQFKGLDIKDYESLEKEIRKINNKTIKLATSMACFRASAAERCAFGLIRHIRHPLTVNQDLGHTCHQVDSACWCIAS